MKELRKKLNFSLWCDFLERDFLDEGLKELLKNETVNGVTSNPSIFKSAILSSSAYREDFEALKGKKPKEIYEELAIKDISNAADILNELYENDDDGFVSIEVDPNLYDDAEGTIKEAKYLYSRIAKKNVMIKIPATEAGYEAIEELIASGISVNSTLIFSPTQSLECLKAYKRGYERFGNSQNRPKGVISVFVSRFDRKLDEKLKSQNVIEGLFGIINATKIYNQVQEFGLKEVKTLFASTGVKGDKYKEDYYITNLLFKDSINTAPLATIEAFLKNNNFNEATPRTTTEVDEFFKVMKIIGIDIDRVYEELMSEGLKAFVEAFDEIMDSLK